MWRSLRPQDSLAEKDVDRGLSMLLFDGVFAQVMAVLTTGAFLIAFALQLGASNKVIGLLAAVGPLAQIIQLPSIILVERLRVRKVLSLVAFTLSRLSLLGIALVPWLVPRAQALPLFLALLGAHFGFGAVGGCAFNSWIRDLIPESRMAGFFARRLTFAIFVGALLSMLGGVAVDAYKAHAPDAVGAYSFLFAAGCIAGIVSVFYIGRMPEPTMPRATHASLRSVLAEPFMDRNFRNLLVFLGAWSFAVNFAGPFFAVYLLVRLGLSMTWVLGLSVLSQLFNVLFFGLWGRLADRFSNKSVLVLSVPLFFLTFLIWPFTTMPDRYLLTMPLLITIHVLAGVSAAGVTLCAGNLALKSAPFGRGAAYMAVNALVSGVAATISPILAGFAADWFAPYELKVTLTWLNWQSNLTGWELPTIDLKSLDFVFLLAFLVGVYSVHRLLAVKEGEEVPEAEVRQAFLSEMRRMVRQVSTVAGMRQLVSFPFAYLMSLKRRSTDGQPEEN